MELLGDESDVPDGPPSFGMAGWTYERELLVGVTETLMSLRAVLIAVNSEKGKVSKVQPLPRPKTAVDRIAAIRSKQKRGSLLAQLVPHEGRHPPA